MKAHLGVLVLAGLAVAGCDAKEPYARAGAAEAEGKLAEARALYAEVCTKAAGSPLCALGKRRSEALVVREAFQALDAGEWAKAKELFTTASTAEGAAVKAAGAAGLEDEELKAGLLWEEAQKAEKAAARAMMERLAATHAKVAPKAREWLAKNGPVILLGEIEAACKPGGVGSCLELGEQMADRYPGSAEGAKAQALVDQEYDRTLDVLRAAEGLLVQRLEVYMKNAKHTACILERGEEDDADCRSDLDLPPGDEAFSTGFLEKAFEKKLGEIGDAGYVKRFRARWAGIEKDGEHDFTKWEKRGEKKKTGP